MTKRSKAAPYLAACALALLFFGIVETVRPYYFLQDDNRDIFLPLYVHNYRAALDGQLAQFNFFQSLGKPHFATGQAATLHPLPYVSIFLSETLFGHVFASMDILVLLYLLLGAAGMVFLMRRLGFSGAAGVFAATAWCLNPFNMLTSQSWTTYAPMIGLLPWVVAAMLLVYRERTAKTMTLFVVTHLAIFYVGAPQFFLYTGLIELGLFLWLALADLKAKAIDGRGLLRMTLAFALLTLLVTALCMPLLLPMWQHTQLSAFRGQPLSFWRLHECRISTPQLLNGLTMPFAQFYEPIGREWCETYFPASFTHQGYLATLCALAYPFLRRRLEGTRRRVLDACYAAGLLLLLGALGGLTPLIAITPVVNRFRWPFKYFGFANFLLLVCIAPAFDLLLARFRREATRLAAAAVLIALTFVNLAVLDVSFPRQGFFEHLDPVPLQEPLRPILQNGRTIGIGCRGIAGETQKLPTIATLGFDYATLWELHYFGGYDPLVPYHNYRITLGLDYNAVLCGPAELIPVDSLRRWGVRYYILNEPHVKHYEPVLTAKGMRRVHADPQRVLLEDPGAAPLVGSRPCRMESIGRVGDDITTTVNCSRANPIALRFLFHPFFTATVDGQPAPISGTPTNQIAMRLPAGRHVIQLSYDDPMIDAGFSVALFALAVVAATTLVLLWRKKTRAR